MHLHQIYSLVGTNEGKFGTTSGGQFLTIFFIFLATIKLADQNKVMKKKQFSVLVKKYLFYVESDAKFSVLLILSTAKNLTDI
jgi:hypothetical protein